MRIEKKFIILKCILIFPTPLWENVITNVILPIILSFNWNNIPFIEFKSLKFERIPYLYYHVLGMGI